MDGLDLISGKKLNQLEIQSLMKYRKQSKHNCK
jgi:hypothetical protein